MTTPLVTLLVLLVTLLVLLVTLLVTLPELATVTNLYSRRKRLTLFFRFQNVPVVVCNGELERTRSDYYPPFWNAREMGPLREFAREFEGIYWVSNFKGSNPAVLFRAYPEPWQVLRRRRADDSYELVYTSDEFPGVQKVALEILPKFL